MEKADIGMSKATQDLIGKHQRGAYDRGMEAGLPREHLELIKMEATGGDCPRCGVPWKEIRVQNEFAEYVYYDPACACFGRCKSHDYGMGCCRASFHREESAGLKVERCPSCGWEVDPTFGRICKYCGESYGTDFMNTYQGLCPACKKRHSKKKEAGEY